MEKGITIKMACQFVDWVQEHYVLKYNERIEGIKYWIHIKNTNLYTTEELWKKYLEEL